LHWGWFSNINKLFDKNLEFGSWSLEAGVWRLEFGDWEFGIWNLDQIECLNFNLKLSFK
jgi:hypothetical protein